MRAFDEETEEDHVDLTNQLRREQAVIQAMHNRPWWRIGILARKPWCASWKPRTLRQLWQWLAAAHDCQDPAVGCSCTGGFRFPTTCRFEGSLHLADG